jgi:hypothetical protein
MRTLKPETVRTVGIPAAHAFAPRLSNAKPKRLGMICDAAALVHIRQSFACAPRVMMPNKSAADGIAQDRGIPISVR